MSDKYEECLIELGPRLKKRGIEDYTEMTAKLCRMRVSEGTVREFAVSDVPVEDSKRTFAQELEQPLNIGKETIDPSIKSLVLTAESAKA